MELSNNASNLRQEARDFDVPKYYIDACAAGTLFNYRMDRVVTGATADIE